MASVRHASLDEGAVRAMRNKLLSVVTLVARNSNEVTVAPMVGSGGVYVCLGSGVRRSVLCWFVWQESGFSRREDVLTYNLLRKEINKFCIFFAILQR
jgi:hypothetical protein